MFSSDLKNLSSERVISKVGRRSIIYGIHYVDNMRRCPIGDTNCHTTHAISRLSNRTLKRCFKNCYIMYTSCSSRSSRDISTLVLETFVRSGLGYQPSIYKMCGRIRRVNLPLAGTSERYQPHTSQGRVCSDITSPVTTRLQGATPNLPNIKRSMTRRLVNCRHGQLFFTRE